MSAVSLLPTLTALADDSAAQVVRFEGPDLSIQGPVMETQFGRSTFKEGIIELKGKKYKIFTNSRYGNIGALGVDNTAEHQEVLFFTSSFKESVTESKLPVVASQSFDGCLLTPYNALAVVYDVTGVEIKDENGASLDFTDASAMKKHLMPNLNRTLENSKSSAGYCRTIEQVPAK